MSGALELGIGSWLLIEGLLKASALIVASAAAALTLRRAPAATRHLVWTAGLAAVLISGPLSLISGPLSLRVPRWTLPLPPQAAQWRAALGGEMPREGTAASNVESRAASFAGRGVALPQVSSGPASRGGGIRIAAVLIGIWGAGAALLALYFGVGAWRLRMLAAQSQAIDDERIAACAEEAAALLGVARSRFRLRWTERTLTPLTWGIRRPFILLPAAASEWSAEKLRQALIHEIAHVQRRDVLTQAAGNLACVCYWFNPLVWWAARQMLTERERACDDQVLASGSQPSSYAHELLEIARSMGAGWSAARIGPAMARRPEISERLLAVLDTGKRRGSAGRTTVAVAALAALAAAGAAAAVGVEAAARTIRVSVAAEQAGAQAPAGAWLEEARRAILATEQACVDALARRDKEYLAQCYSSDAVLIGAGGLPVRGRAGAADNFQYLLDIGVTDLRLEPLEFYAVGAFVAEWGRASFHLSGRDPIQVRYLTLWKKEDGRWLMHRDFATP